MSAQEDAAINLGNLPSDVVRKITAVGFDSIQDMKLITPRWNSLAHDHLIRRPVIKRVDCHWYRGERITFRFVIPPEHKKYLGIQNVPSEIDRSNVLDSNDGCEFHVDRVQLMREEGNEIDFLRRVFDRCSSVELLVIKSKNAFNFVGRLYMKPIKRVTGRLKIDELRLQRLSQEILNFLKYNTVRLLSLSIVDIDFLKESRNFFIEASFLVSKIEFNGSLHFWSNESRDKYRTLWKEGKDWLNETGKITATLAEKYNGDNCIAMCISVEGKEEE